MNGPLLVTGAQGFIGRWFVAHAAATWPGIRIVGTGRSVRRRGFAHHVRFGAHTVPAPLPDDVRVPAGAEYRRCDLTDEEAVLALVRDVRPRAIVHLAGALRDEPPAVLYSGNVGAVLSLLRAVRRAGCDVDRIVIASSGSVYGAATVPIGEEARLAPPDAYALSKLSAEAAARAFADGAGMPLAVARIFNVAGAGLDERHACARFASQAAAIACARAEPVMVVGDLAPTRDIIDVRDVAEALRCLLDGALPHDTYNVASGRETPMSDVLSGLIACAGIGDRIRIERSYARPNDYTRVVADIGRLRGLGFAPRVTLAASLRDLYAYYRGPVARAAATALRPRPARVPSQRRDRRPMGASAARR